jgi:hypothetical protein
VVTDVERVLGGHAAVAEVGVVAHDGTSTAFVVVAPGASTVEQELLEHSVARLAPYEVPSSVVFVDHLPRSFVGKLLAPRAGGMGSRCRAVIDGWSRTPLTDRRRAPRAADGQRGLQERRVCEGLWEVADMGA